MGGQIGKLSQDLKAAGDDSAIQVRPTDSDISTQIDGLGWIGASAERRGMRMT